MTKEKLTEIMYLFRDLWCQNIDLSTIDEFIEDIAEREVKLFAIPDVIKSVCEKCGGIKVCEICNPFNQPIPPEGIAL